MLGLSLFLDKRISQETGEYVKKLASIGFEGIFTSIHIPEDDASLYRERLEELASLAKTEGLELMVDMSGQALESIGLSLSQPDRLKAIGLTGLRMDFDVSNQDIANLSQNLTVALNASTITDKDLAELKSYQANFNNLIAWHNYYPRPETGLSTEDFMAKNALLKEAGLSVTAFVAGDKNLRAPLKKGLPTLEKHRYGHLLAAALDLFKMSVDQVYIGDAGLTDETMGQFEDYLKNQTLTLFAENRSSQYFERILGEHQNRPDPARDVIRSANSRFGKVLEVLPEHTEERKLGSVTIDNKLYGRYMGEIQITKKDLPADPKVNVIAHIRKEDQSLLSHIAANQKFRIKEMPANKA